MVHRDGNVIYVQESFWNAEREERARDQAA
jgi:hypothetical protein